MLLRPRPYSSLEINSGEFIYYFTDLASIASMEAIPFIIF